MKGRKMRRLLDFFCWLFLSAANLALSPLVWITRGLDWLMLSDEERWEQEEEADWARCCRRDLK